MSRQRIVNARIVNEGNVIEGDLLIENGRIAGAGSAPTSGATVIDAGGAWLLPGMIDDQAHFREPGFTHKGTIATESAAAVAGGITSYMEMPNCNPLTIDQATLNDKHTKARPRFPPPTTLSTWGATNDNIEAIKSVDPATACGIKVFMGASTGDMLVDDPGGARRHIRRHTAHHRHPLRRHAHHPRQRGQSAGTLRRQDPIRGTPQHPLRRGVLQVVFPGRRSGEAAWLEPARTPSHHRTGTGAFRARRPGGEEDHRRGLRTPPLLRRHLVCRQGRRHQVQPVDQAAERPSRRCSPP